MSPGLESELVSFVLWLTPCGQVEPPPDLDTIGQEARKLINKLRVEAGLDDQAPTQRRD